MSESISETIDDGGNAFPAMLPGGNYCTTGMSLLDYFAGQAMSYLMTDYAAGMPAKTVATECYLLAVAMLNAREAIHANRGAKETT